MISLPKRLIEQFRELIGEKLCALLVLGEAWEGLAPVVPVVELWQLREAHAPHLKV